MKHLIPWFERLLSPLEPIPTDSVSTRVPWDTYTCAVFDVYGTLLISASGDIGLSTEANRTQAMAKTMDRMQIGLKVLPGDLVARLHATILRHQDWVRSQGVQYPEVEIREVWLELLDECQREDLIHLPQRLDVPFIEQVAVVFECLCNPVWPMPGALSKLAELRDSGKWLGIVSNAQFYTPLLLEFFLGSNLTTAGFRQDLCFYSYAARNAKPGTALYLKLCDALKANGRDAEHCIYVGNDQRNDIYPAQQTGLATALFAGDKRSLRLRKEDPDASACSPDFVITDWITA